MRILVIINPHSGKTKHGFFERERIENIFSKYLSKEHRYEIFVSRSPEDVAERIASFVKEFDVIAPTGGDGTLNHFVNSLIPFLSEKEILVFPIGGGSLNVVQKNVIPHQRIGTAPRILCDLVNSMSSSPEPQRYIRKVRTISFEEKGSPRRFGFMFANGLVYRAMNAYYQKGVGPEVAFLTMLELFLKGVFGRDSTLFEYMDCDLLIDGREFQYKKVLACVASSFRKMILFTRPFVEVKREEGFYFMACADPIPDIALNFLWVITGRKVLSKMFSGKASRVSIYFDGGYTIDGELFERKRTEVLLEEGPAVPFLSFPSGRIGDLDEV